MGMYAAQLCAPDMIPRDRVVGVPFLAPVPTAKVKITKKLEFDPIASGSGNTQTFFSFSPEAILFKPGSRDDPNGSPDPLYYGHRPATADEWVFSVTTGDKAVTRESL